LKKPQEGNSPLTCCANRHPKGIADIGLTVDLCAFPLARLSGAG